MPHHTHHLDPATGVRHWYEYDASGTLLRHASFGHDGPAPEAVRAADRSELAWLRAEFGAYCVELYEATYGLPEEPVAPAGAPVTAADFERAWQLARRDRHFTQVTTGPLPVGLRLPGTVSVIPWGAYLTGLFVDLGLPVPGFVDMVHLPREPEPWPAVGTAGTYEVLQVRLNCEAESRSRPQVRLKPVS
ncbi:hypothetical protein [Streptomyces sp. Da 82-17]|uniref:hypothetical protein n=1 Tax=Streptomyces sp. Da 82-17 TaxID=3377116 RepID=UPI0038D512ED